MYFSRATSRRTRQIRDTHDRRSTYVLTTRRCIFATRHDCHSIGRCAETCERRQKYVHVMTRARIDWSSAINKVVRDTSSRSPHHRFPESSGAEPRRFRFFEGFHIFRTRKSCLISHPLVELISRTAITTLTRRLRKFNYARWLPFGDWQRRRRRGSHDDLQGFSR